MEQKKAKQATIDYTEARNELLELNQQSNKFQKDFEELKAEKEHRTSILTSLYNTLNEENQNLQKRNQDLKEMIAANVQKMTEDVANLEKQKEELRTLAEYHKTHNEILLDMKKNLKDKNEEKAKDKEKLKADVDAQNEQLEELKANFNTRLEKEIKNIKNNALQDAKDKKNARAMKNNELEEQWNIRKIEMRKQRDKFINESEEKKELHIQHQKLDDA